jgi:hypothetical protein
MAKGKKQGPAVDAGEAGIVEDFYEADDGLDYEDVSGKEDLPEGVDDVDDDEPVTKPKRPEKPKSEVVDDDEIPADLKGKTPAQIAKMLRDAQSLIGRQGSELGDLRKTHDEFIRTELARRKVATTAKDKPADEPEIDDLAILTNPKDAIAKLIASHPALKDIEGKQQELAAQQILNQRERAFNKFQALHADAGEILADSEFRAWIEKSQERQRMMVRANKNYDVDAANEIFSTWKELKSLRDAKAAQDAGVAKDEAERGKAKPVATKKEARVPTGGNASPRTSGDGKKKHYRRSDIVRMMINDPEKYASMTPEFDLAYSEGRVH